METETDFGYYTETYQLPDSSFVNVEILDTGGQERYNAINKNYYRIADCCLLVYDITNEESFKEIINYYLKEIKENCKDGIKIILLGNKTDLENRVISKEDGIKVAEKNGFIFMETSCELNSNVSDAFETLISMTNEDMKKNNTINATSAKDKFKINTDTGDMGIVPKNKFKNKSKIICC